MSLMSPFWPELPAVWTPRSRFYRYFARTNTLLFLALILGLIVLGVGSFLTATVWAAPFGLPMIVFGLSLILPALSTTIAIVVMCASIIVALPIISSIFAGIKTFWDLKFNPPQIATAPILQNSFVATAVPPPSNQVAGWFKNILRPSTAEPSLEALNREQEADKIQFITSLNKNSGVGGNAVAATAVLALQGKLSEYAERFRARYRAVVQLENSLALINEPYLGFQQEIALAAQYLNALAAPAMALDAAGLSGVENEVKKKARDLLIACAPDRHQNKGPLVDILSTEFMKLMIFYKNKLLDLAENEEDIYGVQPFYKRYDEMAAEVKVIQAIKDQMWQELTDKVVHTTDMVPVFDENRIMGLLNEFEIHLRRKKKDGEMLEADCERVIGVFGYYCLCVRESLRIAQREINVLIEGPKVKAQLEVKDAELEAKDAELEAKDAELEAKEAIAKTLRSEAINSLLTYTAELIESGRLNGEEPSVLKLLAIQAQGDPGFKEVRQIAKELEALYLEKGILPAKSPTASGSPQGESSTRQRLSFRGYQPVPEQPQSNTSGNQLGMSFT